MHSHSYIDLMILRFYHIVHASVTMLTKDWYTASYSKWKILLECMYIHWKVRLFIYYRILNRDKKTYKHTSPNNTSPSTIRMLSQKTLLPYLVMRVLPMLINPPISLIPRSTWVIWLEELATQWRVKKMLLLLSHDHHMTSHPILQLSRSFCVPVCSTSPLVPEDFRWLMWLVVSASLWFVYKQNSRSEGISGRKVT